MADITMCVSNQCTYKDKCYRHIAKPNKTQSCCDFQLIDCDNDNGYQWFVHKFISN